MVALARGFSKWGMTSMILLLGDSLTSLYNSYLYEHGRKMLFSFVTDSEICVIAQLAALVCGAIAMKQGSKWWVMAVLPAAWLTVVCFMGDL
jgi:hypothetical protein